MSVRVPTPVMEAIRREAEDGYPHEVCGFLLGSRERDGRARVERIRRATNARDDEARTRYTIDPLAYREVERDADREGREIVGFYHSHPDAPARPSAYDLEHAWPRVAYLIVAIEEGRAGEASAWRLDDDRSRFHRLEIDETSDRIESPSTIEGSS